jgi:hypothetical protein
MNSFGCNLTLDLRRCILLILHKDGYAMYRVSPTMNMTCALKALTNAHAAVSELGHMTIPTYWLGQSQHISIASTLYAYRSFRELLSSAEAKMWRRYMRVSSIISLHA